MDTVRSVPYYIQQWETWIASATFQAAGEKDLKTLEWIGAYRPAVVALVGSARLHGVISASEQSLVAAALDRWYETEVTTRMAIISFVDALQVLIVDQKIDCANDVAGTFFLLMAGVIPLPPIELQSSIVQQARRRCRTGRT